MAAGQEAIDLLRSIDNSLKALASAVQPLIMQVRAQQPKPVASAKDLDGKYGDPILKFNPRDWAGPSFKDRRFSECPPELLDLAADTFEYFGRKADENHEIANNGKPKGDYSRADAARARGWAKRMRDGAAPRPTAEVRVRVPAFAGDDDAGF